MKKIFIITMIASLFLTLSCKSTSAEKTSSTGEKKLIALTFDDGPNTEMTNIILDKLEKHDVVASFFVIGQLVNDSTKPVLDRIVSMGCEINNHSWAWDSMNNMTPTQIKKSVNDTTAAIKKYSGQEPKFFRAPNLATSDELFDNVGLPCICGVTAMDWAGCGTNAKDRAKYVLNGAKDGAIILLHDVQPYPHPTPEALDIIIPKLKKQGYEFVTVSELFKRKGITPDPKEHKMWTYVE